MAKSHTKYDLQKLVSKLKDQDYVVRFEKGNFNSGYCILEEKKVIVVNKFHDIDARVENLRRILGELTQDRLN